MDNDLAVVELDGVVYHLAQKTTGGEYLDLRKQAVTTGPDGKPEIDLDKYEHANLIIRLRINGERVDDAAVREIPRSHYQTLASLAIRIDNAEAGIANDFLSQHLPEFQTLQSVFEKSSTSPQSGQEASSDSEKPSSPSETG